MFLKTYNSELVLASWAGASPNIYRKHVWIVIKAIAEQMKNVVSQLDIKDKFFYNNTHSYSVSPLVYNTDKVEMSSLEM